MIVCFIVLSHVYLEIALLNSSYWLHKFESWPKQLNCTRKEHNNKIIIENNHADEKSYNIG